MGTFKMNVKRLRYIAGRYFWRPSKTLREQGYKSMPLGADAVRALEMAQQLNAQIDRAPIGEMARNAKGSVASIIRLYTEDDRFTRLAENTRRTYISVLRELEKEFGRWPIATVQRHHLME